MGLLVGNSRSPAVNAAISAVLTFLGAFTIYLMGNRRRYVRVLSAFVLIVFPFFVSYGAYIGSKSRVEFEEYERREALRDAQLLEQFKVKMEVFRYERTKEIDAQYSGNSSTGSALAPEIDPLLPAIESD